MRKQLTRRRSVRTVLIVTFVALIVVNVGLASALSLRNAQKASGQLAGELQNQITLQIQDHLNAYLALPPMINQITLDNIELGLLDPDDLGGLERYLWRQTQRFPSVSAITYANERAEYVGTSRDVSGGPISLVVSGPATGHAMEIYSAGEDGRRAGLRQRYPNYDPRPRPWYQAAAHGEPTWTPIFVWTSGAIGTDAVAPVYHQDGSLRGVLDVSLTLDGISHYLYGLKVGKTGKTFIIERSGLIVASSERETPYVKDGAEVRRLSALESGAPLIRGSASALLERAGSFDAIAGSRQVVFHVDGDQFVQVTPFRAPYGLDWLIVVVVPEADFLAEIEANSQNTIVLMVVSLLLGIVAAIATAGWISRPVRQLNRAAKALALGRWDLPVPGHAMVEIDELASSFNDMASQLQASFAALASNERRLRETMEAARMGAWEWDIASDHVIWSELVEPLFGLAPGSFGGTYEAYFALIPEHDRELLECTVRDALARRSPSFAVEHRVIWPDGTLRWLEAQGQAVFDEHGAPLLLRGTVADVTERKLLQQQLVQAQKMEAIGRLAGGIAHDFNNILTYMLGTCSLILFDLAEDDPLRPEIEGLEDAVMSASQLTHQLLAFSRQQALQPLSLDLNRVVSDMRQLLSRLIGEDVVLRAELSPEAAQVRADPGQVEQVILNLAVNARDAMPRGGTLTVETALVSFDEAHGHESPGGAPYVRLSVRDTGSGIDSAVQARIFDPFFTTKEPGKGTGLGLSTVHGIVTQSGGQILVESALGGGSTFKIYLPRDVQPAAPGPEPAEGRQLLGGQGSILLVEDDGAVRDLAARVLRIAGYTVVEAPNGPAALEALARHGGTVDLLLTDVVMPGGLSGFELAGQLQPRVKGLRVLYMSGYAEPSQTELPAEIDLLQKPFAPEDLLARVAVALCRS